jgi:enoyl reductase-like protein
MTRRALFAATALIAAPSTLRAQTNARLLIVGGGFGGASAASFARRH